MASKLDLSFSSSVPEGDHAIICIVGEGGTLLPTLDKTLAASVIAAMSTAGFAGDKGKSLTLHLENANVLLIGVGDDLLDDPFKPMAYTVHGFIDQSFKKNLGLFIFF